MTLFYEALNSCCRAVRLAAFVLTSAAGCAVVAHAQTPPYALFQYSTLTASGNAVTATWVPVVTAKGTIYKNITLLFEVDSAGNLTLAPGYPEAVPSPVPLVSSFIAGNYVGPSTIYNGQMLITISGPGVASGGTTEWSLAAPKGAYVYTYPGSATWYVGPIASNPLAARIKAAGITSTAWSYGVGGTAGIGGWQPNTLIGVSQVGNTITFVSFTNNNGDRSEPVDQVTYTLVPQP
ncbi:MAG: hypothetical protein ABSE86_01475 [Bryobacteraceae bacterium]|jgi:hypothetical protein